MYGDEWPLRVTGIASAAESEWRIGQQTPERTCEGWLLVYVKSGMVEELCDTHRVLVAATPITIRGNKLKCLVEHYDGHHLVDLLPLPGLVRFAEKGIYSGAQVHAYLSEQLAEFNLEDYAAFVLGCTHFNLFKQELRTLLPPQMHFVDGNAGTVRQLIRRTVDLPATHRSTPGVTYFASGRPITDPAQLQFIQNVLAHLEKMYPIE